MALNRVAAQAFFIVAAVGLTFDGVALAADASGGQSQAGATQEKKKIVCKIKKNGKTVCRNLEPTGEKVANEKGFFGAGGGAAGLAVGTTAVTAAALNTKNCGKGNNSNTGGGTNNGNCSSP